MIVDVSTNIINLGAVSSNGTPNEFIVQFTGTLPVPLVTNFAGVAIAPTATVSLALPLLGSYSGAFYAQDVSVAGGVRVTEYPYACTVP